MASLEKFLQAEGEYIPTVRSTQLWFNVLNEELFRGGLAPVDIFDFRDMRHHWGWYIYSYDKNDPVNSLVTTIRLNTIFPSRQLYANILAHEMVHHIQFTSGHRIGHGPSFQRWVLPFRKRGLDLKVIYKP